MQRKFHAEKNWQKDCLHQVRIESLSVETASLPSTSPFPGSPQKAQLEKGVGEYLDWWTKFVGEKKVQSE